MKIRRFFGKDMREALKKVKDELGGNAVIMSNNKTDKGIELVAAIDPADTVVSPKKAPPEDQNTASHSTLRDVIGDKDSDSLHALLQRANQHNTAFTSPIKEKTESNIEPFKQQGLRADEEMLRSPAFVEPVKNETDEGASNNVPPPSVLEPEQLDGIRAELESIRNVLKYQVSELSDERKKRSNPVHHYLLKRLTGMGVSRALGQQLANFLPHQIDEKEGWKYLLNLLANRIFTSNNEILGKGGVVALVGPTGTGKTTTLAKLAAKYSQKYGADQVAMVTIDTYRIAAFEQLATYGRIIGCVAKKAQSSAELSQLLYQLRNKKLVLIDTAGFSQRDARLIEQLKQFDDVNSAKINLYLTFPAGSQYRVLKETVKTYAHADLKGCILTKLDECYSLGEALSVVIENDLSLSYVTDGQRVPEDIKLANASNLTLVAAKLYSRYGVSVQSDETMSKVGAI